MNKKITKILKNDYIKVFLLSLLIGVLMLLPNIIKNKGLLLLSGDFQTQQIAFNINVNNEFRNGNTLYTLNNDLGSSIVEGYSFYSVASPLFLLSLIFPAGWYPYLISIFLILKYAFTGLFAYIYFKDFVKRKELAMLGALLYTFSGFQIFNMLFFHYHELVMLFPLFLYSIDKLFKDNKKGLFAIIFAITILTNFVFAFGELVFLFIYLIINGICKRFKYTPQSVFRFIFELLIGVGLSMCILIPSTASIFGNPRVGNTLDVKEYFIYPFTQYIKIFQSMLIPTDTINNASLINTTNWSACEMWIPFFGIFLACVYILKNKKDYLSIISIILLIFMFVPLLNSSFTMFNTHYYARWFYIPSIFIAIMTIKTLDERLELKKGIILFKVIWELYIIFAVIYVLYIVKTLEIINYYYIFSICLSLISIFIAVFLIKKYYKHDKINLLIIPVIICILLEGYHYIYYQSNHDLNYDENQLYINAINNDLIKDDEFYRVKYLGCMYNMNLYFNEASIDSFNSSVAPSVFKMYNSLGIYRKQNTSVSLQYKELIDFFSTKYIVSCNSKDLSSYGYKYLYKKGSYTVYLNKQYKEMGIIFNSVATNDELNALDTVLEKTKLYASNYIIDDKSKVIINNSKILNSFSKRIGNGLYSELDISGDATVVYTIPYDDNFVITVNGVKTDYFEINNGLIGINLEKGSNKVSITYEGNSFKRGLFISLISFILLLFYCMKKRRKNVMIKIKGGNNDKS